MHSSKMRTDRLLTVSRSIQWEEGLHLAGGGGVGRHPRSATGVGGGGVGQTCVICDACWDRQTPVKSLPCPKLRLRAIKIRSFL